MSPYGRLMIIVRHQCRDAIRCTGETCQGNESRMSSESFLLDRVGKSPVDNKELWSSAMIRLPVARTFDTDMALGWLEASERRFRGRQNRRCAAPPLETLLHSKRMRVIDVVDNKVVTLEASHRYIALSYVWGKGQARYNATNDHAVNALVSTSNASTGSLEYDRIPLTIRDAIKLVKYLRQRFLWVDALCIRQDDPTDKEAIISQMDAIYANAFLTIIAADGFHADCGLSRLQDHEATAEHATTFISQGVTISLLPPRPSMDRILNKTTWSSRGWTLQEHLMSTRCLIFTAEEVFYHDNLYSARESYESVDSPDYDDRQNNRQMTINRQGTTFELMSEYEEWNYRTYANIVDEYTRRRLTHHGDRLDAFTGIISRLQPTATSPTELIALSGLPRRNFVSALHWWPFDAAATRQRVDAQRIRCLPSWSWVGWSGHIGVGEELVGIDDEEAPIPRVVDRANIILDSFICPFEVSPTLQPIVEPLKTVLHLWVETIPCEITRVKQHSGYGEYRIDIASEYCDLSSNLDNSFPPENHGSLDTKTRLFAHAEDLDESFTYKLIKLHEAMPEWFAFYILVCTQQDPCERIAILEYRGTGYYILKPVSMYVRLS